jgi:hypothetical protein
MPRSAVHRQAPQQPDWRGSGNVDGYLSSVFGHVDNLVQRLGITLASIIVLTWLTLASLYFIRDSVVGIVAIFLIAIVATVFARWMRLDRR